VTHHDDCAYDVICSGYQQLLPQGEAKMSLQGGKIDDITVLVAVVTEEDVAEEVLEPQESAAASGGAAGETGESRESEDRNGSVTDESTAIQPQS